MSLLGTHTNIRITDIKTWRHTYIVHIFPRRASILRQRYNENRNQIGKIKSPLTNQTVALGLESISGKILIGPVSLVAAENKVWKYAIGNPQAYLTLQYQLIKNWL